VTVLPSWLPPPDVVTQLRAAGCVFAEDEAQLLIDAAGGADELGWLIERRVAGEPLEYILGWVDFDGLRVAIAPGVFVPRRRSELLVREASKLCQPGAVVVDLCCGSGALGRALHARVGDLDLHSVDVDPGAVQCATGNLQPIHGRVYLGDLFEPLPARLRSDVHVIMANVPYVPTAEIARLPPEARDHEPAISLDGGADGLDVLRRVVADARAWLRPGGHLLSEIDESQYPSAAEAFAAAELRPRLIRSAQLRTSIITGTPVCTGLSTTVDVR
jgi:release factor glutamine methyltransferase